jgi:class 3 adenylate cyclase
MQPETRYAAGSEGLIAYQVVGEGPIDVVYLSGSTSHVDARWEIPAFSKFSLRLASFSRLVHFDRRGNGASDPVSLDPVPTWEEWADDLRVVMDAVGSEQAAVFAVLDAGPMAMLFAATYPDRVSALILANTTARWLAAEDYPHGLTREFAEAYVKLVEERWGTEDFAALVSPSLARHPHARMLFARYMRASASPRVAAAQVRPVLELDLRSVLPTIRAPTLVLHRRDFVFASVEHARYLAEHVRGAKLFELDGADSALPFGDADPALDAVQEFLTGVRQLPDPDRLLATVLFTDLVSSTARAAKLGDRRWRELLDQHDQLVRREVEHFRGHLWKATGDGALATFDAPGRAIRCALSIREALGELDLEMRAGAHAGEVELRNGDVGGIAVHIAARVAASAAPQEVLVSRTVADLVAGSGIALTARGTRVLKGVPGKWKLYTVEQ